jgi:hypothetical protein
MMWLTWRQHRLEALGALLVVIPIVAIIGGVLIAAQPLVEQAQLACRSQDSTCGGAIQAYFDRFGTLHFLLKAALLGLPALPGLFIGAPLLAREFEQGTDQLVWSQGTTRRHWLVIKLGLLVAMTCALAASLAVAGQMFFEGEAAVNPSPWTDFDYMGPALFSYAFFSLALGVAAGAAIGKTVPAMALALVGFVGIRMGIAYFARPNFLPPLQWDFSGIFFGPPPGDIWTIGDQRHLNLQGHPISDATYTTAVDACSQVQTNFSACLHDHGVAVLQAYQPGDRFWLFQSIETAIFTFTGIALLTLTAWLVARRS